MPKLNIWRIKFHKRWQLNSASPIIVDTLDCEGIILTRAEDLHQVKTAIRTTLTNQEHLIKLQKATWLGQSLNVWEGKDIENLL